MWTGPVYGYGRLCKPEMAGPRPTMPCLNVIKSFLFLGAVNMLNLPSGASKGPVLMKLLKPEPWPDA